ncbi:MAG: RHS repeat-associated core domain-containing protein, partial [Polyangiaceae bacterium]
RMGKGVVPGKRSELAKSNTRFVWDGDVLAHEIRVAGRDGGDPVVEERTYLFEDVSFEPASERTGKDWRHYINTPVGTPSTTVTPKGAVAWQTSETEWAEPGTPSEGSEPGLRFPGQMDDPETGLRYSRFRYYDPQLHQFVSSDTKLLASGINFYRYPENPLRWLDPMGHVKVGVGTYSGGGGKGGHHIHSQAAMRDDPNYSKYSAICISQDEMDKRNIDHQAITNKQRQCYADMKAGLRPNTMKEHDKIAYESLVAGGADPAYAKKLVAQSKAQLKAKGVKKTRAWG